MAKVRLEMKPGAERKIRYLPKTRAMLEQHGRGIAREANSTLKAGSVTDPIPGYRMSSQAGVRRPSGRWRVSVAAVTPHAKRHDRKYNTLMRAIQLRKFTSG